MACTPRFAQGWGIAGHGLLAETFGSRVWEVTLDDGTLAVVKELKDFADVDDELRGAHLLRWRRGHGLVRLLDQHGNQMLLEHAGTRHLSAVLDEEGDRAAALIAADVLERLHAPSGEAPPSALQPLRERFAALFAIAGNTIGEFADLYRKAAATAERLLSQARDTRPLHGDLHHDNILLGPRGWLAIDPKGVLGDPGFDAANMFYNPLGADELCRSPERIAGMAGIFAKAIGQGPRRILDHALAYGCLSAAWHAGDGNVAEERRELAVASAIATVALSL